MRNVFQRGFTLVELLLVVAVISVLVTIVTTASANAIHSARGKRAEAMRVMLQAGIAAYQAANRNGDWPGALKSASDGGQSIVLGEEAAQNVFRIVVQKSTGESGTPLPLLDPHGLFVAPTGAADGKSSGMSYTEARRGGAHRRKLGIAQMVFGYQGAQTGKFHRYNIVYHAETDSVTVSKCCHNCLDVDGCKDGKCRHCHKYE